jgi:hypothetical protein
MVGPLLFLLIQLSGGPKNFAEAQALAEQQVKSLPLMQSIESDVSLSHAVTLAFQEHAIQLPDTATLQLHLL